MVQARRMRIFVTGGTGFIGSHFLRAALRAGHTVMALRRRGSAPRTPLEREPQWVEGDLESDFTGELAQAEALVHLAAAGVDPSTASWTECFRWNVTAALVLWQRAADVGIKDFVVCGSCFEYGRSAERYDRIPVTAPLEPVGPYAASKAAATVAALGLAVDRQLRLVVLRPFHVFGDGESENRFWPSMRRAAFGGADFPMTPGEQIREFAPVDLVAEAFLAALKDPPAPAMPKIRNIGVGVPQTLRAFAESWWSRWNAPGKLKIGALAYRGNEVMRYVPEIGEPR